VKPRATQPLADGSPFLHAIDWSGKPEAMRRQFLVAPGERVRLEGTMRRVWHRPWWLSPLLWFAAQAGMLFPEQGAGVPVKLTITGSRDSSGRPVQRWSRQFRFRKVRRFDTYVSFDAERALIIDRVGPGRILAMESVMVWRPTGELVMWNTGWSLRAGKTRIKLPDWLFGEVTGVQTAHPSSDGRMGIVMRVTHPLLGDIFGYEGTVHIKSETPAR
jgi:hypothetical protein